MRSSHASAAPAADRTAVDPRLRALAARHPGKSTEVIVQFSRSVAASDQRALVARSGGRVTRELHVINGLAARMSAHNGYPVTANIGYPTPGSFGSWAGNDLRIPVITLELPRDIPADKAWEGNREALLEAIRVRKPE